MLTQNGLLNLADHVLRDRPIWRAGTVTISITLDRTDLAADGLTRQIYGQLRASILEGTLRSGDRLPPSRELARTLGVARLTVATAYDWLRAEGYVYGRVGSGTYVAPAFGESRGSGDHGHASTSGASSPARAESMGIEHPPLTRWARHLATIPLTGTGNESPLRYDLNPGHGAAEAFPWVRWRRIVGSQDPADLYGQGARGATGQNRWDALLGPIETRTAIAEWLRRSRAVRSDPGQLLIAGSVQQMLALLARLLVEPEQWLLVEDPSYIGFHAAFLAEGARLLGVPVDAAGIRVDALPAHDAAPHLAVVTPSHQYPTGVTMSLERRITLLEWARRSHAVVVEDDYDGDLRLEGQPLEALRALDTRDDVIYIGTFAKALYPAMRLAYAVLPQWLIEPVVRARAASDRHPIWRDALAVARFIEAGELERHLARVRRLYRARRDALVSALAAELAGLIVPGPAEAGIHLLGRLPEGVDDQRISLLAAEKGVAVSPLSPHFSSNPRSGLLLGFGALAEDDLAAAMRILAPIIHEVAAGEERP